MTDESREEREQRLRYRLSSVQGDAGRHQARLSFSSALEAVAKAQTELRELEAQLASGRARGFVYQAELEPTIADAQGKAAEALSQARAEADRAAGQLTFQAEQLHEHAFSPRVTRGVPSDGALDSLEEEERALDRAIDAAEKRIAEISRPFTDLVDEVRAGVKRLTFTLDLFGDASFTQQADEAPLVALTATYKDAPGGEKEGVLFLSNQRVRFEGRVEKVLERSFLVFASKTEIVKTLLVDEPIGRVAKTETSREGVIFKDEILTLVWQGGGKSSFELDDGESAEAWAAVVGYLMTGDIEQTRVATAPAAAVALRFAETCEGCGAPLPVAVKGQRVVACSYCKKEHGPIG